MHGSIEGEGHPVLVHGSIEGECHPVLVHGSIEGGMLPCFSAWVYRGGNDTLS